MVYYSGQLHLISQTACSAYLHSRALKKGFVVMQPVEPVPKISCDCPAWERGSYMCSAAGSCDVSGLPVPCLRDIKRRKAPVQIIRPATCQSCWNSWLLSSLFHGYLHLSDSSLFGPPKPERYTQDGTCPGWYCLNEREQKLSEPCPSSSPFFAVQPLTRILQYVIYSITYCNI